MSLYEQVRRRPFKVINSNHGDEEMTGGENNGDETTTETETVEPKTDETIETTPDDNAA